MGVIIRSTDFGFCALSILYCLGPMSDKLIARGERRRRAVAGRKSNAPAPVDLMTASGSGLDPQISPEAALFQVRRLAAAREERVREFAAAHVEDRNLALDGPLAE